MKTVYLAKQICHCMKTLVFQSLNYLQYTTTAPSVELFDIKGKYEKINTSHQRKINTLQFN